MINKNNHFTTTFMVTTALEEIPAYQRFLEQHIGSEFGDLVAATKGFDIDDYSYGRQYALDLYVFNRLEMEQLVQDIKKLTIPGNYI